MSQRTCLILWVLLSPAWAANPVSAQRYEVIDLGTVPGFPFTVATAINNNSHVVGFSDPPLTAVQWHAGRIATLPTLGGALARAYDINSTGAAVGFTTLGGDAIARACAWYEGDVTDLGTLPGTVHSVGLAINDLGQVVGSAVDAEDNPRIFLWDPGTGMTDLGVFSLGGDAVGLELYAINDSRQIVGRASDAEDNLRAFLWENGAILELETLGGSFSFAWDINDAGIIVGSASNSSDWESYAVRWSADGIESLGMLGRRSEARAVNNRGQIVGHYKALDGDNHAFLWRNGVMHDLNDLIPPNSGWFLRYANDINDNGEIVGVGRKNGQTRAFLLRPRVRPTSAHEIAPIE